MVPLKIRVVDAHDGYHGVDQFGHDGILDAKQPGVPDGPTDDSA